jgi:3-hydroxyisobutyrate dehydrogenase-like beta-hydroxyacid dehydrogenase
LNKPAVGFIGLGNMGGAIAGAMIKAGIHLHVCDISQEAVARLVALGATPHSSPKAVASTAGIVCTCLASNEASAAVLFADNGVIHGSKIHTLVEMSTTGSRNVSASAAALAERRIATVDAPVSGGAKDAAAGILVIMVAGSDTALHSAMPILSAISSRVKRVGSKPGQGQLMKLINNLLAGANMAAAVEALALGAELELDQAAMVELVSMSSGQSRMLDKKAPTIVSRQFDADAGGTIALLAKDFGLAFEEARLAGVSAVSLPTLSGARAVWDSAMNLGLANHKVPELITVIERNFAGASTNS